MRHDVEWTFPAPLDGWLWLLCRGWKLPDVVEPMGGPHGAWSILLHRSDEP